MLRGCDFGSKPCGKPARLSMEFPDGQRWFCAEHYDLMAGCEESSCTCTAPFALLRQGPEK